MSSHVSNCSFSKLVMLLVTFFSSCSVHTFWLMYLWNEEGVGEGDQGKVKTNVQNVSLRTCLYIQSFWRSMFAERYLILKGIHFKKFPEICSWAQRVLHPDFAFSESFFIRGFKHICIGFPPSPQRKVVKKGEYFSVRLAVLVDLPPPHLPPLRAAFCDFILCAKKRCLVQKRCFKPFLVGQNFHIFLQSGP